MFVLCYYFDNYVITLLLEPFNFRTKLRRKHKMSLYIPFCQMHTQPLSLSTLQTRVYTFIIDSSSLTHQYHPRSIIYIKILAILSQVLSNMKIWTPLGVKNHSFMVLKIIFPAYSFFCLKLFIHSIVLPVYNHALSVYIPLYTFLKRLLCFL